jgi:prophage tail gpP-like protein
MADVRLIIGSRSYGGWKSVAVTRGIEQIAGSYELQVSEMAPDGSAASDVRPDQRAALSLDGKTVITGYIDDVEISHEVREHTIVVRGRDATGDLVDCAAIHKTGQWKNQTMLQIARDLCAPFGISVTAQTDVGKPFTTWNIEPGETVFENVDRMARHRGVLLLSDGAGGLLLARGGTERVSTALVLGENILASRAVHSYLNRYRDYYVKGQRPSDEDSFGDEVTQKQGTARDTNIVRYRPRIELIEDTGDAEVLRRRAEWRRNVEAGSSARASITVQGWTHATGVWQPNTLVVVNDRRARIENRTLLIVQTRQVLDLQGTRTELTVTLPEAFSLSAIPEKEFDF